MKGSTREAEVKELGERILFAWGGFSVAFSTSDFRKVRNRERLSLQWRWGEFTPHEGLKQVVGAYGKFYAPTCHLRGTWADKFASVFLSGGWL